MRPASAIASALWVAFVISLGTAIYFGFNPPAGPPISWTDAAWAASFIGFPTAGALVVRRMPRRPLGWVLLVAPLLLMVGVTLSDAARYIDDDPSASRWMLWLSSVCFGAGLAPLLTVPLYLPDGKLPSPRWRWAGKVVWTVAAISLLHTTLNPGPMEASSSGLANPLGLETLGPLFDVIEVLLGPALLLTLALGAFSLIVRFRSARGIERQQIKWLMLGAVVALASFGSIALFQALVDDLSDAAVTLFIIVAILALPTSIATAVMRDRLYDVDVVINKTLVYGSLTAILALAYLTPVVVLQALFGDLLRGDDLFVAGSTLVVAALFRPLRARVQGFIDRRFYRRRYDAAQTLGEFSSRLRNQVDLDSLNRELVGVVTETMQPAHASVWLRRGNEV